MAAFLALVQSGWMAILNQCEDSGRGYTGETVAGSSERPTKIACFALLCAAMSAPAQWLQYPTPGLPRTADGKLNSEAPVPRATGGKPDLSGLWILHAGPGNVANVTASLKPEDIQPWAAKLFRQRLENLGIDDPWTVECLPAGPRTLLTGSNGPARIIQTQSEVVILYEDLTYRQIFLDGRSLPKDPNPSWMGYSIGHWDGDTLIVETTGFNERSWLDMGGHPHTEELRTVERYRRTNYGHMEVEITFNDPNAYAHPWTISYRANFAADTEMLEYVCGENEKDRQHLRGLTSQQKNIVVPVEILSKYVGVYNTVSAEGTAINTRAFVVSLSGDQLMVEMNGQGKLPLIALSETTFSPRLLGTYEFLKDDRGVVTHLIAYSTEGNVKAVRRQD